MNKQRRELITLLADHGATNIKVRQGSKHRKVEFTLDGNTVCMPFVDHGRRYYKKSVAKQMRGLQ